MSMYSVLNGLGGLISAEDVITDGFVFRLHSKWTMTLLLAFSVLVTGTVYFGDPIKCINEGRNIPENLLNTYCWIHGTYSVESAWQDPSVAFPGVANSKATDIPNNKVYHSYYQWVSFILLIQAAFFSGPRFLWKSQECGRIKRLMEECNVGLLEGDEKNREKMRLLASYFVRSSKQNSSYYSKYQFAELLALINVFVQMWLLNCLFNGKFIRFGLDILLFTNWKNGVSYDPMVKLFPTVTKCEFMFYGAGGDSNNISPLCLISLNILNQKIFAFIWFWFILLVLLSAVNFFYRLIFNFSNLLRMAIIRVIATFSDSKTVSFVMENCSASDVFVLKMIAKNMKIASNFELFLFELARRFELKNEDERLLEKNKEVFETAV